MTITDAAQRFMKGKYLIDEETPDDMIARVVNCVTPLENTDYQLRIANQMQSGLWLPSSPFLMNAGTAHPMLSSCFVVAVPDDIDGIFDSVKNMAKIQKWGGGTGMNFSKVREQGSAVGGTKGVASGPISFMKVFDVATEIIKQGGKRRGANIAVLEADHPDILEFVRLKRDLKQMKNFNLSVMIPDAFMRAVEADQDWVLKRRDYAPDFVINARELWNEIVHSAWETGDPGLLFEDHIEQTNPTPQLGRMDGCNPCGEISLYNGEACNLASINLTKMLDRNGEVNWQQLHQVVDDMVVFLDSALDVSEYPMEEITESVHRTRKIGIGVTGLHEMLIGMGLPYDSVQARALSRVIMESISSFAQRASQELATYRGPFPAWAPNAILPLPQRNATLTCIAPTGTISMIMGVQSSGCEPLFSLSYKREVMGASYMFDVPPVVVEAIRKAVPDRAEEIITIARSTGSVAQANCPDSLKKLLATSQEITPRAHIEMQAALQECTDNNISKTVNLPADATQNDIAEVYKLAWTSGCHGVTVFRDGCRDGDQVLTHVDQPTELCPQCGGVIVREEGCKHCPSCGWSACGS